MNPDLTKLLRDSVDSAERKRGTVNLLMAGMTGVGKSTLANTVFSENLAATGQGKPVTTGTNEYSKPGFPLTLLDTRGLETARYRETLEQLRKLVIGRQAGDTERQVHAAWLCLSEDGRRVQDAEIELAAMLVRAGVPFLVVITKARADQGFAGVVADLLPGGAGVYRVRALTEVLDDGHVLAPFGLRELIEATVELVPESSRNAFAAAQKVSLDLKVRRARLIVNAAAASAAATAAVPLPLSNLFTLAPVQLGMLAGINATFGLSLSKTFLQTVISSALGIAGTGYATRAIASALLKFIPAIGTAAGGVIAATTASAMTIALGRAYIQAISVTLAQGEEVRAEALAEEFRQQFRARGRELGPGAGDQAEPPGGAGVSEDPKEP